MICMVNTPDKPSKNQLSLSGCTGPEFCLRLPRIDVKVQERQLNHPVNRMFTLIIEVQIVL